MKQIVTQGIVLARTNYQEADRILTVLTPDHGKLRALAKGVRKSKSKLAGGVELLSVSEISFIRGKGDISTLTSSRLQKHYTQIVKDIDRTMLAYDCIKLLNKATEDEPESAYFELLVALFESLDRPHIHSDIVRLWFYSELLRLAGHTPNLQTTVDGQPLSADSMYVFAHEDMSFAAHAAGTFGPDAIKFLRLCFAGHTPELLQKVQGVEKLVTPGLQLVQAVLPTYIRT